jgi:predicted Rossmann fold nucleotide-binding protein DprA/Smf involved in DNA uptake
MTENTTTTVKAPTKREVFLDLLDFVNSMDAGSFLTTDERIEYSAFITHEIDLLDRKHGGKTTKSKSQIENDGIKENIAVVLGSDALTATAVAASLDLTVQKISALLRQMVDDGAVVRTESKGKVKTTFSLV